MSWTDERINLLKRMWKEGKSAADIAKTLGKGVTRNAVIGKAHRMGLSGRPSPIKKPVPPARKEVIKKEIVVKAPAKKSAPPPTLSAAAAAKKNAALAKEVEELRRLDKDYVPPGGGGVALVDLTERMCKWPIGDPREADFSFCGRAIRPGTPYCPEHASMAYQTSSRGRNAAAAAAAHANEDREVEDVPEAEAEVEADDDTVEAVS